jgi:hypothetical protein
VPTALLRPEPLRDFWREYFGVAQAVTASRLCQVTQTHY